MNTSFVFPHASFSRSVRRRNGFTLIELLVVIAIIGILAALLSGAILNVFGAANRSRNDSNAHRLEAAIIEYWHDMGEWPMPNDKSKVVITKSGGETTLVDGTKDYTYSYKMRFDKDNDKVVSLLLGADFNGHKKDFLDLHGFATTVDAAPASWPAKATVDAWLAYRGEAVDEESGKTIPKRTSPLLVYREDFYECPHCSGFFSRPLCTNTKCPFYTENETGYRMSSTDRVSAAKPYVIEFDLKNKKVTVTAP